MCNRAGALLGVVLVGAATSVLPGCSAARPPAGSSEPMCGEQVEFDGAVPALEAAESRLALTVRVTEEALARQLDRSVPRVLARAEGRSMGAPGKVSYDVRRAGFRFATTPDALLVRTRLTADIDVCKPLGPVCLHYGSCRPEWGVEVSVPSLLSLRTSPRPALQIGISKGCVLRPVGYDATPELRRITQRQARSVRGQMQRQVDRAYAQIQDAWSKNAEVLRFSDGPDGCVQVQLESLTQSPLVHADGALSFTLQAAGTVSLSCPAEQPVGAVEGTRTEAEDTRRVDEIDPTSELLAALDLAYGDVARALTEQLRNDGVESGVVRLASGMRGGRPRLFAGVEGFGGCSVEWHEVSALVDSNALVLRPLGQKARPVSSPVAGRRFSDASQWLAERASIPIERNPDLSSGEALVEFVEKELRRAQSELREPLTLHHALRPIEDVRIGEDRLRVVLGVAGRLELQLGSPDAKPKQ